MRTDRGVNCEGQPRWRKAQASNPNGNCVEIAVVGTDRIGVRNSRNPGGEMLVFPSARFRALLAATRRDAGASRPGAGTADRETWSAD